MSAKEPIIVLIHDYKYFKHISKDNVQFIDSKDFDQEKDGDDFLFDELHSVINASMSTLMGTSFSEAHNGVYSVDLLAKIQERIKPEFDRYWGSDFLENADNCGTMLFKVLDTRKEFLEKAYQERVERGAIETDDVARFFPKGSQIISTEGKHTIGGIVETTQYRRGMMGGWWEITAKMIVCRKEVPEEVSTVFYLDSWQGVKKLSELELQHRQDGEVLTNLIARGELFRAATNGASYLLSSGPVLQPTWFGIRAVRGDGRVMIDAKSFKVINQGLYDSCCSMLRITERGSSSGGGRRGRSETAAEDDVRFVIQDSDLWRCSPYVMGFSFRAKEWGLMAVENISPIRYREDAFDQLVLDPEYKRVVKALVENNSGSFADVVDGKGGGCIFLLEGEPGQGKTLLAETVAETLKKPLYPVSVGELGTDPDELERRLRQILDIATVWDAVMLIDEADIFLEARDSKDINRNAMVGVLLRLLEYHEGVLFLTTNRADNIDRAFFSRISLALSFPTADEPKRRQVWVNLLSASGNFLRVTSQDIDGFAKREINGRQIKNAIRLSQTQAKAEKRQLNARDIEGTLDMGQVFIDKLRRRRSLWHRVFDWGKNNLFI